MNLKHTNVLIRIGGIAVFIILIVFFSGLVETIKNLLENTVSKDNELSRETVFIIQSAIVAFMLLAALVVVFSFPAVSKKTGNFISQYIDISRVTNLFFNDEICRVKNLSIITMVTGTFVAVILIMWYLYTGIPVQEGIFETVSSSFFLFSAIVLLAAIFPLRRINTGPGEKTRIRTTLFLLAFFLLIIFGEEISWGQHLFKWESSGAFKEYNFQEETNAHNFLNPILRYTYPTAAIGLFTVLCLLWFFPKKQNYFTRLFIPHPSLFFIMLLSACVTMIRFNELFEQVFVIFIFLYSIRILLSLAYPSGNVERVQ